MKTIFVSILIWLSLGAGVFAHSPVSNTQPPHGASLAVSPPNIVIAFKNAVRLTKVTVASGGAPAVGLDLSAAKSFTTEHTLPAPQLASGVYLVEWRALAKDGHAMKGSFSFSIK